jgi:mRNA interferase MazF
MTDKNFNDDPKMGDIVLVPFPFTDLSSHKVRPALVLSGFKEDVTVSLITSQNRVGDFCVSVTTDSENGLKHDSNIVASNITTLDKKMILGKLGFLKDFKLTEVKSSLKKYLNL